MAPNLVMTAYNAVQPLNPLRWSTPRLYGSIDLDSYCRKKPNCADLETEHWNTPVPGHYTYISGKGWFLMSRDSDKINHHNDANATMQSINNKSIMGNGDTFHPNATTVTIAPAKSSSTSRSSSIIPSSNPSPSSSSSSSTKSMSTSSSSPSNQSSSSSPEPVLYSHILHEYILARDLRSRIHWARVIRPSTGKKERLGFFRLDDGYSWVIAYDKDGMEDREPNKWLWVLEHEKKTKEKEKKRRVGKMRLMTKEEWVGCEREMVKMERY